jgi:release factor glutamine methyltransferase
VIKKDMTAGWALEKAIGFLLEKGVEDPQTDAELLLADVYGMSRNDILFDAGRELTAVQYSEFWSNIIKRSQFIPVQYITGYAHFMDMKLRVSRATLIPRPETEILAEEAIKHLADIIDPDVLDIGSGSGNIAIALASKTNSRVVAVEKSPDALDLAMVNAAANGVDDRISFLNIDMLLPLSDYMNRRFDLIVSNPPYVDTDDYFSLPDEVRKEPALALEAGPDGLRYISYIIRNAPAYLKPGGAIFLEIGYNQKGAVEEILRKLKPGRYDFVKDYNSIDRIVRIFYK